jgi:hypothetical protein
MEIKVLDLDISTPIDTNSGIKNVGGNIQVFETLLDQFEHSSLLMLLDKL